MKHAACQYFLDPRVNTPRTTVIGSEGVRGFMVVEIMLVIVIAAIIILLGLQYYRSYNSAMKLNLVTNDVATIRESLNRFYDAIPCNSNGVLQADLNVDVIAQLDIPSPLTLRLPYIESYHAMIMNSGAMTDQQKPEYMLAVSANINPRYESIMSTLASAWQATHYVGTIMYWNSLSNNTTTDPGSDLWDLNVSNAAFRNLKNSASLSAGVVSHAYCAK